MYQKLLSYLAALGIALGGGQAVAVSAYLEEIPDDLITDLVDDLDSDELQDLDRVKLSEVLSEDPRSKVRKLAALLAADTGSPDLRPRAEALLKKLTKDPCATVRADAVFALSCLMGHMGPLECNELVCSWATSEHTRHRYAIAHAVSLLEHAHPGARMCIEFALEHLATDRAWKVRAAVAKAAFSRFDDNRDFYAEILQTLERDTAKSVRRIAKRERSKASSKASA